MANKKISELTTAAALNGTELVEVVQGGENRQTTAQAIANLGGGGSVQSVTGDGVDNTDPDNPVISFPTTSDIGAVSTSTTITTTSPLSGGGDLSTNRTFSILGLSGLGTATQLIRINSGATGFEYYSPTVNPMTTLGDIIYSADGSGTPTRLGIGSTGQVLTVVAGVPAWAAGLTPTSTFNSLTTGNGVAWSTTSVTTGTLVDLTSTSTAAGSNTQTVLRVATSGANGTAGQTTFGARFENTHTGSTSTNNAADFSASGAATKNNAINVSAGDINITGTGQITKSGANALIVRTDNATALGLGTSGSTRTTYSALGAQTHTNTALTGVDTWITYTQGASSGAASSITGFKWVAAAHTNQTASTEVHDWDWDLDATLTFNTGAITTQRTAIMRARTYAAAGASTITTAATLAITGPPIAGTNVTLTNTYSLVIETGNVLMTTGRIGFANNPTAQVDIDASTSARASLRIRSGVAPTSPNDGDIWHETTNTRLMFRQNATSIELIGTSSVNSVSPTAPDRTLTVLLNGTTYYIHAKTTND